MRIGSAAILFALLAAAVSLGQPPAPGPPVPVPIPLPPPPPPPPPPTFPWVVLLPSWIGAFAAIAQAQKQQREREEEEVSTPTDGPEVEYKIIRNSFGAFKDPDKFRAALAEEARCGWQLVEKFDDNRVRLRRPISCRAADAESEQDPYRTRVGGGGGTVAAVVILVVVVVLGALGLIIALAVK